MPQLTPFFNLHNSFPSLILFFRVEMRRYNKRLHGGFYVYKKIEQSQSEEKNTDHLNSSFLDGIVLVSPKEQKIFLKKHLKQPQDRVKMVLKERKKLQNKPLTFTQKKGMDKYQNIQNERHEGEQSIFQSSFTSVPQKKRSKTYNDQDTYRIQKDKDDHSTIGKNTNIKLDQLLVEQQYTNKLVDESENREVKNPEEELIKIDQEQEKVASEQQVEQVEDEKNGKGEQKQEGDLNESDLSKIVRLCIQKGYVNDEKSSYLQVSNNMEYYLHLLNLCKCAVCTCGKCYCNYPKYKMSRVGLNSKEESSQNHDSILTPLKIQYQDTSSLSSEQKKFQYFKSTYQDHYRNLTVEPKEPKRYIERQRMPFLGRSNYQNSYVDWSSYKDTIIYEKPIDLHSGECSGLMTTSNVKHFSNQASPQIEQYNARQVKELQKHDTFLKLYPQNHSKLKLESKHQTPFINQRMKSDNDYLIPMPFPYQQSLSKSQFSQISNPICPAKQFKKGYNDPNLLAKVVLTLKN